MLRVETCCTPIASPVTIRYPAGGGSWVPLTWPAVAVYTPGTTGAWLTLTDRLGTCLGTDYTVLATDSALLVARVDGNRFDFAITDLDLRAYFGLTQASYLNALAVISDVTAEGGFSGSLGAEARIRNRALAQTATDHRGRVSVQGYGVERLYEIEFVITPENATVFAAIVERLQAGEFGTLSVSEVGTTLLGITSGYHYPVALHDPGEGVALDEWINDYATIRRVRLTFVQVGGAI